MEEKKISITRSNLLTIVLALAVVAVIIGGFALMSSAPPSQEGQSTGLVAGQAQAPNDSGSQPGKTLSQLPNMVGGC